MHWTPQRIFASLTSLAAFIAAVHFTRESILSDRQFFRWADERPLRLPIDLSQRGIVTTEFELTCAHACAHRFVVEHPASLAAPAEEWLKGLRATLVLQAPDGTVVPMEIGGEDSRSYQPHTIFPGVTELVMQRLWEQGVWTVTLEIDEPAAGAEGLPQELVFTNVLCGMERMPTYLHRLCAAASGVLSAGIGVPLIFRLRRAPGAATEPIPPAAL